MFTSVEDYLDPQKGRAPASAERRLFEATRWEETGVLCDPDNPLAPSP